MADAEVVTLLIRSPSLKQDEREVEAPRSFSVRELKSLLRRELPGHPAEQDQRLIYSGKLLPDHLKLDEVLSKETRHVMHLVCSVKSPPHHSQGQESQQPPVGTSSTPNHRAPEADGVRQRIVSQNVPAAQLSTPRPQDVNAAFSPFSVYSPQQIMWLQQMYARQYYMQYYAAAAATTPPSQRRQEIPVVPPAAPDPLPHAFPAAANQAPNPEVPAPINPGANQNLRMNAQGGLVEEEDDINRDWLDWVYTAARFSIFLSILYFYSSLSRFMMVLGAMILMYLHTAGWFPFRQRRPPPVAAAPVPQAVPNQQDQNNNLQQNNDHGGEDANATAAAADQAHSFTSTAWVFFKTFFASLIPEGPQAMAQ